MIMFFSKKDSFMTIPIQETTFYKPRSTDAQDVIDNFFEFSSSLKKVSLPLGTLVPQHLENILFVPSVRSGNSCGTHSRKAAFTTTRVGAQVRLRGWRFSSKGLASRRTPILRESHSPTCARLPSPSGSTRKRRGWQIGKMAAKVTCAPNQTGLLRLQARHTDARKHGIWDPSPLAPPHHHPSTSRSWKASSNNEDIRLVVLRCTTGNGVFFRKRIIS